MSHLALAGLCVVAMAAAGCAMSSTGGPPPTFQVRIENIAEDTLLRSATGGTAPIAIGR